ncbi:MAG: hypothetical protein QOE70_1123 [Chthoniobacter sp.]|jgi:hypothetical protein|nr:hypothetical protein [Chthoniobacter sp.]
MQQNLTNNQLGDGVVTADAAEQSEATLAAQEFATRIKQETSLKSLSDLDVGGHYQVRPCLRVRGYMLRLPVIGWTLWFPTAAEAFGFAEKLEAIYRADCCLYDSAGRMSSRGTVAELAATARPAAI